MKKNILLAASFLSLFSFVAVVHAAAPTVSAGAAQTITLPVSTVTLTGTATAVAPATSISTYSWAQTSGPSASVIATPNTVGTSVSGLIAGTYTYSLTVTDNTNASGSDLVVVIVNPSLVTLPPVFINSKMKLEITPSGQVNMQGILDSINGTVLTVKVWGLSIVVNTANAKFGSLANNLNLYKVGDSVKIGGSLDQSASTLTVNAKKVGNQNINKIKDKKDRENERDHEDGIKKEDGNKFPSLDKHNQKGKNSGKEDY